MTNDHTAIGMVMKRIERLADDDREPDAVRVAPSLYRAVERELSAMARHTRPGEWGGGGKPHVMGVRVERDPSLAAITPAPHREPSSAVYAFAEEYVEPMMKGLKDATVRYGDERRVVPGDLITAVTPDGKQFGRLRVEAVVGVHAAGAIGVLNALGALYPEDTVTGLLPALRDHYPDADIDTSTQVRVLKFSVEEWSGR